MSKVNDQPRYSNILIPFLFIFTLTVIFFVDGLTDSFQDRKELSNKLDSLKSQHSQLKTAHQDLKEKARFTDPRVIWLARAIYSETKRPHEMRLVGWVIKNRVKVGFKRDSTYRDVILSSHQFSAFNPTSRLRFYFATLPYHERKDNKYWSEALQVAKEVVFSKREKPPKPLTSDTFWFYSEVSMPSHKKHPDWKYEFQEVNVAFIPDRRFRFYRDPDNVYITEERGAKNGYKVSLSR